MIMNGRMTSIAHNTLRIDIVTGGMPYALYRCE